MKRLTTDTPKDNFIDPLLNYVYSKEGWAHIRHDGEREDVPLTEWAKKQCLLHHCDEFPAKTPEEIDETLCGCMMEADTECPVALAYCFACQASHLRDRLKLYEDILFSEDGTELLTPDMLREQRKSLANDPLTIEELRDMVGQWVWVVVQYERCECAGWAFVPTPAYVAYLDQTISTDLCGKNFKAFRRKLVDTQPCTY